MFDAARTDAAGRLGLDPDAVPGGIYHLLNGIVVPRPIAWVSTRSAAGVDNLAPHSYFTISSVIPPVVQFTSVGFKDSLRNARETGSFVVSVCTRALADQVNVTAVPFPPEESEFDAAGLTREPAERVQACRVAESPVSIECELAAVQEFGAATVVFGRVVWVAVKPEVLRGDRVAIDLLDPVARLSGADYSTIGEVFSIRRQSHEEWQAAREEAR
ncbi:MAG TPA: flavin reductase family protein [Mycobacteriales bacterium]|jgi:flavin reductase (DIM6/NTAB) family NADH-FMN oxidoreductase RutF|nr:flavin reductase family protein [Mycobacteriales bacterium]